ncbi:hypothetical protein EZV61_02075 [Corallincola luteus]|uniref:Uncharacterized protein n=1 Tax=Corallincola luteus TaxID=1775177 RepID=A0ABY2ANK7_9GAMM|nr:hypothetical protein [Corallincola luteus]TCI04781.1 hypothetical protein EZV61_02075 [Corallincola luteus]
MLSVLAGGYKLVSIIFTEGVSLASILLLVSGLSISLGSIGFFGSFIAADRGLNWLPSFIELPVGKTRNYRLIDNQYFVVPNTFFSRIHVYNKNLDFVRGWQVNTASKYFQIDSDASSENFNVVLDRGGNVRLYSFNTDGVLLNDAEVPSYSLEVLDDNKELKFTYGFGLGVFNSGFKAWFFIIFGTALATFVEKVLKKPNKTNPRGRLFAGFRRFTP